MQTLLHDTLRTHLEAVTMTMAALSKLEASPAAERLFKTLAEKYGVSEIEWHFFGTFNIYIKNKAGEHIAHFKVSPDGTLSQWPRVGFTDGLNRAV